jgi:hypothetical protein
VQQLFDPLAQLGVGRAGAVEVTGALVRGGDLRRLPEDLVDVLRCRDGSLAD